MHANETTARNHRRPNRRTLGVLAATALAATTVGAMSLAAASEGEPKPNSPIVEESSERPVNEIVLEVVELAVDGAPFDLPILHEDMGEDCPACGMG